MGTLGWIRVEQVWSGKQVRGSLCLKAAEEQILFGAHSSRLHCGSDKVPSVSAIVRFSYVAGALPEEVLNQPITAADHPFLRDNARSIAAQQKALGGNNVTFELVSV